VRKKTKVLLQWWTAEANNKKGSFGGNKDGKFKNGSEDKVMKSVRGNFKIHVSHKRTGGWGKG